MSRGGGQSKSHIRWCREAVKDELFFNSTVSLVVRSTALSSWEASARSMYLYRYRKGLKEELETLVQCYFHSPKMSTDTFGGS